MLLKLGTEVLGQKVAEINSTRFGMAGAGTCKYGCDCFWQEHKQIAGSDLPEQALNESWNGSSWTEVGDLNVSKKEIQLVVEQRLQL